MRIWLTTEGRMKNSSKTTENAQSLALQALAFLAADEDRLNGFLLTTGLDLGHVRDLAGSIDFQAGVLDHVLANEPVLLDFAAEAGLRPENIVMARRQLPGAVDAA
jgi:Protein of unknown function (DUF3572)